MNIRSLLPVLLTVLCVSAFSEKDRAGSDSGPEGKPAYPLWDGKETVVEYAKRAGIRETGHVVKLGYLTIKLGLIPAGKFTMGSAKGEKGHYRDEGPQHEVTISKPFLMGITEVSQQQYETVMGKNPSSFKGPTNPVNTVSWNDATIFCKKLSEKTGRKVRLPTEAEWEYACRAGTRTGFSFGGNDTDLRDYAWYAANSNEKVHPVGQKRSNAWGLHDMHGNVWEWCSDYYADSYVSAKNTDPKGPTSGSDRVLRSGSWYDSLEECRSASRDHEGPSNPSFNYGFRVVLDLSSGLSEGDPTARRR